MRSSAAGSGVVRLANNLGRSVCCICDKSTCQPSAGVGTAINQSNKAINGKTVPVNSCIKASMCAKRLVSLLAINVACVGVHATRAIVLPMGENTLNSPCKALPLISKAPDSDWGKVCGVVESTLIDMRPCL